MSTRRATISDVAREAGVSPSTASVVFSGKTPVSDATRQRVLEAAAALGYTGPDPRAASLRRGRSGIVGVVFEEHLGTAFLDPVKTLMMDGLTDAVAPLGAGLLLLRDQEPLGDGADPDDRPARRGGARRLQRAAARVARTPSRRAASRSSSSRGTPARTCPRIGLDNREAQRQAASHLRALGHARRRDRDAARPRGLGARVARGRRRRDHDRRDARATRRRARRVPGCPRLSPRGGSFIDEGLAAGRVIFADPGARPTAVIAQSDLLAAGVIRAAEEAGLRVPEDVSVTGFDGIVVDGLAPYELTTLVQPATEKGRAAGQAVAAMLDGEAAASIRFTCVFREGNTTAQLRPRLCPRLAARDGDALRRRR